MNNTITPLRTSFGSPFGGFLADRFFDTIFDDVPFYGTTTTKRTKGISVNYNVEKTDNGFSIAVAAPGVNKDDINVNIESNTITISYTQEEKNESSFACSSFGRSWRLPEGTEVENITAMYETGILTLSIPTAGAKAYTRKITIK